MKKTLYQHNTDRFWNPENPGIYLILSILPPPVSFLQSPEQ